MWDILLAGGGMSGLQLLYYISQSSVLRDKKILIIDREKKIKNDRTWCFWTDSPNDFDEIIYFKWQKGIFKTHDFEKIIPFNPYYYCQISGIDFYTFVYEKVKNNSNITFLEADIFTIKTFENYAEIYTTKGNFQSKIIFDSISKIQVQTTDIFLWQHFKGYVIESEKAVFNPETMTLMDFSIAQENECRFMYILPYSNKKALVEYTIFSENLVEDEAYNKQLTRYLSNICENYKIKEVEIGKIPMTSIPLLPFVSKNWIKLGTSGGNTKSSTGYTFLRSQKQVQKIVKILESGKQESLQKLNQKSTKYSFLDGIFLTVIQKKYAIPSFIFKELYRKNRATKIIRFLNEESNLREDFGIVKSMPKIPFLRALWQF